MLGKKLGVLVLAIFAITVFSVSVNATNFLPVVDQDVYKVKAFKNTCTDQNGKVVKIKPQKGLHMRVFVVEEQGMPQTDGFIPASADIVFYTSTKKGGSTILGSGRLYADYPDNYISDEGMILRKGCGEDDVNCTDAAGNLVDGYAIFEKGFDKKNSNLACDFDYQGYVKTGKKKKINAWSIGWCYSQESPTDEPGISTITNVSKCQGKKWKFKLLTK